jgi:hypothetical protein
MAPEVRIVQMEMKCILYFYMAKVAQVSDVAHGPLVKKITSILRERWERN